MEENRTNIPDRIFKILGDLIDLQSRESTPQAEIENAAMKVQEILLKYNLTLSDIPDKRNTKKKIGESLFDIQNKQKKHDSTWVVSLVNVICRHNLCKALYFPHIKKVAVIGEAHNVDIILYLVEQLIPKINKACSTAWASFQGIVDEKRNTFRRGFLNGCVAGIGYKLQQQEQQMAAQNNTLMALIKVNGTELMEYVDSKYKVNAPNKRAGKLRKSSDSKHLGFEAGKNMELNKGLKDQENKGLIE